MQDASAEDRSKLWRLIEKIRVGMLTTRDGEVLRSRPMHVVTDRDTDSLWLFAHRSDHQTSEVSRRPDINLSFVDRDEETYVSVSGVAQIVEDRTKASQFWAPEIAAWYPEGFDDPELCLVQIRLIQAEYWDKKAGPATTLWEIAKASIRDDTPDIEQDNSKLSFWSKQAANAG